MATPSRKRKVGSGKQRTDVQRALVALRETRGFTQQELATYMRRNLVTIGRWESFRPPHGAMLAELARVAREFERPDLAEVFDGELAREFRMAGGGLGGWAHQTGMPQLGPFGSALELAQPSAFADSSRRSPIYRACRRAMKAIATMNRLHIREVAQGRIVRSGQQDFLKQLERVQIQIDAIEDGLEERPAE
jgi:transcriptional regulator with XRE-family HTH domain